MSRPESPHPALDSPPTGEIEAPTGVSRRTLIANAVLAGTAVIVAPAVGPVVGRAVAAAPTEEPPYPHALDEPLVARVRDPRTGVIDIFFGEEHIVLRDRTVAARLARAVK
jgi:hypothetical protein